MQSATSPLVSVVVLSYNSKNTILDTLNSVYNQTYSRIELIISDDCSTDGTVDTCQIWLKDHCSRFENITIIESPANTGISANCNRGEAACSGEWMKGVAGDDMLPPDAIDVLMAYVRCHPDAKCICGSISCFGDTDDLCNEYTTTFNDRIKSFSTLSNFEILDNIIHDIVPPAPGIFYNVQFFREMGITYDERIPLIEDRAHWINIIKAGIQIHFIPNIVALYRIGTGITTSDRWTCPEMYRSKRLQYFLYLWDSRYLENRDKTIYDTVKEEMRVYNLLIESQKRYTALFNSASHKIGRTILFPLRLYRKIKEGIFLKFRQQ